MKKHSTFIVIVIAGLVLFMFWYDYRYSMDNTKPFEVHDKLLDSRVLIATQGSEYKDFLVKKIIESDQLSASYIKVIDISNLEEIKTDHWSAIVIIHTWEMWQPPIIVKNFVSRNLDAQNLVLFTTSGGGDTTLPNIDGITGASIMKEVPDKVDIILNKLKPMLQ